MTLFATTLLNALHLPGDLVWKVGIGLLVLVGLGMMFPQFQAFREWPFLKLPKAGGLQAKARDTSFMVPDFPESDYPEVERTPRLSRSSTVPQRRSPVLLHWEWPTRLTLSEPVADRTYSICSAISLAEAGCLLRLDGRHSAAAGLGFY